MTLGLYLKDASLLRTGTKTAIAVNRRLPIEGERIACSKVEGIGLAYGTATIGPPSIVDVRDFDARFDSHRIPSSSRKKWWPNDETLYLYPVLKFDPYDEPREIEVAPGVQMDMGEVAFVTESLVSFPKAGKIMSSNPLEVNMPYTVDSPPRPAKNWTTDEKEKCVKAANAVLKDDPKDEQGAVFACIHAAGKTEHPGGEKGAVVDPADYVIAHDLVHGYVDAMKAVWTTAYVNDLPDSSFLFVESGGKKDSEGKTVPRSLRHLPVKDKDGRPDPDHIRNAISRAPRIKLKDGSRISPAKARSLQEKARNMLKEAKKAVFDRVAAVSMDKSEVDGKVYLQALKEVAIIDAILDEVKAGNDGDGEPNICTCPKCGTEVESEPGEPCNEQICPECGARMRGGEADSEKSNDALTMAALASRSSDETSTEEKAGRSGVLSKLRALKEGVEKFLGSLSDVISWGDYSDQQQENIITTLAPKGFKCYGNKNWFKIWPTNAYKDREGEFFTTQAINDFVDRHADKEIKGEAWFWHIPGSKFGTIREQAVVADHFMVQMGTYDDTPVGRAFKAFFAKYPDGHPVIAPNGWGASHGFNYKETDRKQGGIYNWFDIMESSVLPVEFAANPYNPTLEVFTMNDKQKEAFEAIGEELGIDLVALVTAEGRQMKEALEGRVEHKSSGEEQVPQQTSEGESPVLNSEVVSALAKLVTSSEPEPTDGKGSDGIVTQVVKALQLEELDTVLTDIATRLKALEEAMVQAQETSEHRAAEQVAAMPRFSWFQASQAAETILDPTKSKEDAALKSARPQVPVAVQAISSKLAGSR